MEGRISCLDGERYKELVVKEGVYVPDIEFMFPDDDPGKRLLEVKVVRDLVFDDTYPYVDKSFKMKIHYALCHLKTLLCVFLNKMIYRSNVEGVENIKKYAEQLKNGVIMVSNHQYRWEVPALRAALGYKKFWTPAYSETFKTKDYWNLKGARCIPIPDNIKGLKKFDQAIDELREEKSWFLIFPEAIRWDFYKPFKPFHKGAFVWSYKYQLPILPVVWVHEERTGWRKLFAKKDPLMKLIIGEPMFADMSLPRKESVMKLREDVFNKMLDMAGIVHNPWPVAPTIDK